MGGLSGTGQTFCYGIGIGVLGMASKKRIKKRHDHQQLDDDGQRDFSGQGMLQKGGHDRFHDDSNIRKCRANSMGWSGAFIFL